MKKPLGFTIGFCLAVTTLVFGFNLGMADVLSDGANRLVDLQADIIGDNAGNGFNDDDPDDGGWDWEILPTDTAHSASPSPENLFGVTADGILAAFQAQHSMRLAISLIDTYTGMEANPDIDSGSDFGFLCRLSDLSGDSTYAKTARDRWDSKIDIYGGADSLAIAIMENRHSYGYDGLIPWDIGLFIKGAVDLHRYFPGGGYLSDAIDMADVIYNDITSDSAYFDMNDGMEWFYTFGLEGILTSFGLTGVYTDLAADAALLLLQTQNEDGSWPWSEEYPDADIQATAYVVMGFGMLELWYHAINNAAQEGSDYLVSVQQPNGGWDNYGSEYPEVDGECLRAISYYPPTSDLSDSGVRKQIRMPERSVQLPIARPLSPAD